MKTPQWGSWMAREVLRDLAVALQAEAASLRPAERAEVLAVVNAIRSRL